MKITLPFPPSVNSLFGGGSAQKRFPTPKYKAWLKKCPELTDKTSGPVRIAYNFYFPDNRERDTQNYVKAVTDYLVKSGVIENDSWKDITYEELIPMGIDRNNPRVEVFICPS